MCHSPLFSLDTKIQKQTTFDKFSSGDLPRVLYVVGMNCRRQILFKLTLTPLKISPACNKSNVTSHCIPEKTKLLTTVTLFFFNTQQAPYKLIAFKITEKNLRVAAACCFFHCSVTTQHYDIIQRVRSVQEKKKKHA